MIWREIQKVNDTSSEPLKFMEIDLHMNEQTLINLYKQAIKNSIFLRTYEFSIYRLFYILKWGGGD